MNVWMDSVNYQIHSHNMTFNPVAKPGAIDRYVMSIMYEDNR